VSDEHNNDGHVDGPVPVPPPDPAGSATPGSSPRRPRPPNLAELGRAVQRAHKRLDASDLTQKEQAGALDQLLKALRDASKPNSDGLRPHRSWLLLDEADHDLAQSGLIDLVEWVNRVYLQWPGSELPTCFLLHPWVVEELWSLWALHVLAWHRDQGGPAKVAEWHERFRPGVVTRLQAVQRCDLHQHDRGKPLDRLPLAAPLPDSAARIAAHWTAFGYRAQPPYPTPDELTEATTYRNQLMNRRAIT
jgi:hypothetical protein